MTDSPSKPTASLAASSTSPSTAISRSDSARCRSRIFSRPSFTFFVIDPMRLHSIVTSSSRARTFAMCNRLASSAHRFTMPTLDISAASSTFACPAKCSTFPGGTP
ncbi:hypothetical protein AQJ46_48425 [Streptomyces canus]|uniref:Uncharacterized protein n=1 Tax=Streptomyces canus TaxID=58343 RepID=A0A124HV46_9ACTN|nr:hypothetical protein AQJ46_48425 [Streptomyces canus]